MAVVAVVSARMASCSLVFSGMRVGFFLYSSFICPPCVESAGRRHGIAAEVNCMSTIYRWEGRNGWPMHVLLLDSLRSVVASSTCILSSRRGVLLQGPNRRSCLPRGATWPNNHGRARFRPGRTSVAVRHPAQALTCMANNIRSMGLQVTGRAIAQRWSIKLKDISRTRTICRGQSL